MKLRTRLDLFSTALFSALAASHVVACGGSAAYLGGQPGAGAEGGASNAGQGAASGATNSAAGAGTAGAVGGAASDPTRNSCTNPQDLGNGFVQCDEFKHRPTVSTCASHLPRSEPLPFPYYADLGACEHDTDCSEHPYGWCNLQISDSTYCEYGCITDSDCAGTSICECNEPVGRCVTAGCTTDADCKTGYLCRSYEYSVCGPTLYACQSAADTCGTSDDCPKASPLDEVDICTFNSNRFQCSPISGCSIGRPFLVEGAQRLAPSCRRADWSELAALPRLADVGATLGAQLAKQWTRIALMEHASIAAFARFTLQLMSLGAPASLIERATAAMVDETKHAKACFAIASAYAGAPRGPGRLAVERSLDESSLQEIVLNAIREGCVGETVAAIEAREAAEHASDPALRELLLVISEDETRHAELAYRFVKWALSQSGPELERAVRREFTKLTAKALPTRDALRESNDELLRHGILPQTIRRAIRKQAIAEVILPCSRALYSGEDCAPLHAPSNA
jgi:hypothetical protein